MSRSTKFIFYISSRFYYYRGLLWRQITSIYVDLFFGIYHWLNIINLCHTLCSVLVNRVFDDQVCPASLLFFPINYSSRFFIFFSFILVLLVNFSSLLFIMHKESLVDKFFSIFNFLKIFLNSLFLLLLSCVAKERLAINFEPVHEFLKSEHLYKAVVSSLEGQPDLVSWLLFKHLWNINWKRISLIEVMWLC